MQTREKNFVDIEKLKTVYSFQIRYKGKWAFPLVGNAIMRFETREERNAARAEYRKKPAIN